MSRPSDIERMTYAELVELSARITRLKTEKQNAERTAVRDKLIALAKQSGFDLHELMGGRGKSKGAVAVKYMDPNNSANMWTGRGRMPRWMVAATKGNKARKEDFLL
jgi:DNA-binding protein H-NS